VMAKLDLLQSSVTWSFTNH